MTCIIALKHKGKIHMGADSAGVADLDITSRKDSKIFIKNDMLFGFTSSFRMGQIIRYCFKIPDHRNDISNMEFLSSTFIRVLRRTFKENGYCREYNSEQSGGEFLIGYKGKIYHIGSDFQVGESLEIFDSCGCGKSYALGSMYSTKSSDPCSRIKEALSAAEKFSAGVRRPFNIMSI